MSLKIKSIMVNRNNLTLLGKSQVQQTTWDHRQSQVSQISSIRLKSLSQERNIKKIIKMIDSPSHHNQNAKEMLQNMNHLASDFDYIKKSFGNQSNVNLSNSYLKRSLHLKGVQHSKIDLLCTSQHKNQMLVDARNAHSRNSSINNNSSILHQGHNLNIIAIGASCRKNGIKHGRSRTYALFIEKGIYLSIKHLKVPIHNKHLR